MRRNNYCIKIPVKIFELDWREMASEHNVLFVFGDQLFQGGDCFVWGGGRYKLPGQLLLCRFFG